MGYILVVVLAVGVIAQPVFGGLAEVSPVGGYTGKVARGHAPGGLAAYEGRFAAIFPRGAFDTQGTLAFWFKTSRTIRKEAVPDIPLITSEIINSRISPVGDSVRILTEFSFAEGDKGEPCRFEILLTHLRRGKWYHAAWVWDDRAGSGTFFLDGIAQGSVESFERKGHIGGGELRLEVGGDGLVVSAPVVYAGAFDEPALRAMFDGVGYARYTDEGLRFTGEKLVPEDVDFEHPVYETSFDEEGVLAEWRLEGGVGMKVCDGDLVLENGHGEQAKHLVCWFVREVPSDFLLEFTVCPENRRCGLNIVFFNARGLHGENIFEASLKPRDGTFSQYHSGDLNNYHISYWAGGRGTANLRKNKGFHLAAVGKDLVTSAPEGSFQTIRLYKRGGCIRLMVDDVIAVSYDDDGRTYGLVHTHSGWIGLRQMSHTGSCRYGHLRIWPLSPRVGTCRGGETRR